MTGENITVSLWLIPDNLLRRIGQDTLIDIMGRKTNTSGIELSVKAILKWTDAQCAENGIESSVKNRRAVMGESLYEQCVSLSGRFTTAPINCLESTDLKWKEPAIGYQPRPKLLKDVILVTLGHPVCYGAITVTVPIVFLSASASLPHFTAFICLAMTTTANTRSH